MPGERRGGDGNAGHDPERLGLGLREHDDHGTAATLARAAGDLLLELRGTGPSGRELGKLGDEASQAFLDRALTAARPDDAVLSEEALDDRARLDARRVWIIDPLDGTREFGELERDDWGVHVALWSEGDLVAGAVALPARDEVLSTPRPSPPPPAAGPPRMVVSRTRAPDFVPALAERVGARVVTLGSAGAKIAAVVTGQAELYVHAGGQYEWDSAAPVAVARAAGLHASRLDGSPLRYNRPDPSLPDLVVCRPELAGPLLAALEELGVVGAAGPR